MRVAFVIGHHAKDKGAFSKHLNLSEWDFYNKVAEMLTNNVTVFHHDPNIKGYTSRIQNTAQRINNGDYDIVIEGHFNAATPSANGVETLYYFESLKGKKLAKDFSKLVSDCTGIKLRNNGLKALVNKKDRGFASVYYPIPPTILIEPFFGSNLNDCQKVSPEIIASIIDDFIDSIN